MKDEARVKQALEIYSNHKRRCAVNDFWPPTGKYIIIRSYATYPPTKMVKA